MIRSLAAILALALAACGGHSNPAPGDGLPPGFDTGMPDAGAPAGPLPAPTNLAVPESGAWGLALAWDTVPGANGYRVYAGLAPAAPTLAGDATYNGFRYSPVELGATYDFRVAALDRDGKEGTAATLEFTLATAAPANLKIVGGTSTTMDLTWDAVPHATGYVLYRCTPMPCTVVADTPETHATATGLPTSDLAGFEVKAKNAAGESAASERVFAYPVPAGPAIVVFGSQTSNSVEVTYEATQGTDAFALEIGPSESGPFFACGGTVYPFTHLTATGLHPDGTYFLRVTARNQLGSASGAARSYTMTGVPFGTGPVPATPEGLALAPGADHIDVSWTSTFDIYTSVNVLAGTSEAGPFVPVAASGGHGFAWKPLAPATRYCVALEAVSVKGGGPVFSGVSAPVCATTTE